MSAYFILIFDTVYLINNDKNIRCLHRFILILSTCQYKYKNQLRTICRPVDKELQYLNKMRYINKHLGSDLIEFLYLVCFVFNRVTSLNKWNVL